MLKKIKIKNLIFMALWLILFNSIGYNFEKGSTGEVVSYAVLWGILLCCTDVLKLIK